MFKLWDIVRRQYAGSYETAEDALHDAGALLSYLGPEQFQNRYMVIEPNEKETMANVVYGQDETFNRAYAYVDEGIYYRQENKTHLPRKSVYVPYLRRGSAYLSAVRQGRNRRSKESQAAALYYIVDKPGRM